VQQRLRNNRRAQGWWFTPGGRIRKKLQGPNQQHARWQWQPLEQAARDESDHAYVRGYAQWLRGKAELKIMPLSGII
jgi:hypothetical protein